MIAMEGCSEERKGLQVVDCKRDGLYHSVGRSSVEPIQCIRLAGYYAKSSQSRLLAIQNPHLHDHQTCFPDYPLVLLDSAVGCSATQCNFAADRASCLPQAVDRPMRLQYQKLRFLPRCPDYCDLILSSRTDLPKPLDYPVRLDSDSASSHHQVAVALRNCLTLSPHPHSTAQPSRRYTSRSSSHPHYRSPRQSYPPCWRACHTGAQLPAA